MRATTAATSPGSARNIPISSTSTASRWPAGGAAAASAARGSRITATGGAFFLASDTLLALLLFLPGMSAALTGPWVMLTYTIGQGLLVLGAVRLLAPAQERNR